MERNKLNPVQSDFITAIASGNLDKIKNQKSKLDRGVKVYHSLDAFLFDVYKGTMTRDGQPNLSQMSECEVRLAKGDHEQIEALKKTLKLSHEEK